MRCAHAQVCPRLSFLMDLAALEFEAAKEPEPEDPKKKKKKKKGVQLPAGETGEGWM